MLSPIVDRALPACAATQPSRPLAASPVSDRHSLRLSVDMLSGCPGSCSGCGLTERMAAGEGFWDGALRDRAIAFINRWIGDIAAGDQVQATKLYFGRGDYLGLSDADYDALDAFFGQLDLDRLPGARYVVFSSSCLLKADRVARNGQRLAAIASRHGFEVIFEKVVDIARLGHAPTVELYRQNIATLSAIAGWTDIAAQVGPTVLACGLTPAAAYDAIRSLGADLLEVTIAPTTANRAAMAMVWSDLIAYVEGLYRAWEGDRSLELALARQVLERGFDHAGATNDLAGYLQVEAPRHRIGLHIDHEGNVAPYHTGIGKIIAAAPGTGFPALGLPAADTERQVLRNARRMAVATDRFAACGACERRGQCVGLGGGVYLGLMGTMLGTDGAACPLGWKSLLARIEHDNHQSAFGYQLQQTSV